MTRSAARAAAAAVALVAAAAPDAATALVQTSPIRLVEVVRVGGAGVEFGRITDVAADAGGGVWIADGMAGELYLHRDGSTRRIAGPGRGPGELTAGAIELVVLPGDSVLAIEPHMRRWSLFAPSGAFMETVVLDGLNALARVWRRGADGTVLARLHGQTVLLRGTPPAAEGDAIVAFDRSGRRVRTVARLPLSETFRMGQGGMPAITLLASEPVWDVDEEGGVLIARTGAYVVERGATDGTSTSIARRDIAAAPVPAAVEARARELLRETLAGRRMSPQVVDQLVGTAAVAQRMPALGAVLAGPRATTWVLDVARTAEELVDLELPGGGTWRVYARDGRPLGTVSTPIGFRATGFDGVMLSGIVFDELGATSALVLRVEL